MVCAKAMAHAKGMENVHAMPAIPVNIVRIVQSIITNHFVMIANCCVPNAMRHAKRTLDAVEPVQSVVVHAKKDGLWKQKMVVLILMNALSGRTSAHQINSV